MFFRCVEDIQYYNLNFLLLESLKMPELYRLYLWLS